VQKRRRKERLADEPPGVQSGRRYITGLRRILTDQGAAYEAQFLHERTCKRGKEIIAAPVDVEPLARVRVPACNFAILRLARCRRCARKNASDTSQGERRRLLIEQF